MSRISNSSILPDSFRMTEHVKVFVDIIIVLGASLLGFFLENFVNSQGWITIGIEARGVGGVLAGAFTAVGVVFARGGSFADLGFKRPENWAKLPLQVFAILTIFIVAQSLVPILVSLFIELPEPDFSRHAFVSGNLGAALFMALVLPLTASIPEEIIYRGFLIGRLSKIFDQSKNGAALAVLIQALIFGSVHFLWGAGGMLMTLVMGIVWGTAYLLCGRNLWVVILAHSAGHILYITQLYFSESIFF